MVSPELPESTAAELQEALTLAEKFRAFQSAFDDFGDRPDVRESQVAARAWLDGVNQEFTRFSPVSTAKACQASPEYPGLHGEFFTARSELVRLNAAASAPSFPDSFGAAVDAFRSGCVERIGKILTWLEEEIRNNAIAPGDRPIRHAANASECIDEALYEMECIANSFAEESFRSDRIESMVDAYHCVWDAKEHLRQLFRGELLAPREVESLAEAVGHVVEATDFLGEALSREGFLRDPVLDGISPLDEPAELPMKEQFFAQTCREFDLRIRENLKTAIRRLERLRILGPAAVLGSLSVDQPTTGEKPDTSPMEGSGNDDISAHLPVNKYERQVLAAMAKEGYSKAMPAVKKDIAEAVAKMFNFEVYPENGIDIAVTALHRKGVLLISQGNKPRFEYYLTCLGQKVGESIDSGR